MPRLYRFDYKTPFFYMVTLKRLPGLADFSAVADDGRLAKNAITTAFEATIRGFHGKWRCIEPISPFVVMPDHIHLMMKIKAVPDRVALGVVVSQLAKALRADYWRVVAADAATRKTQGIAPHAADAAPCAGSCAPTRLRRDAAPTTNPGYCAPARPRRDAAPAANSGSCAPARPRRDAAPAANPGYCALRVCAGSPRQRRIQAPAPIFEKEWHDWIVKRDGQLAAFRRYIRENPERAALRRRNARFFGTVRRVSFLGRDWFAYGNCDLLKLPVLMPFKGHRATKPGSPEWDALLASASRIGPGGAGVSTFMSPLEKACGNAIARAGGALVVLSPDGFSPRWHPPREKERYCAKGRMLFLSLYEASSRKPDRKTLYDRCHEMADLAVSGLAPRAV